MDLVTPLKCGLYPGMAKPSMTTERIVKVFDFFKSSPGKRSYDHLGDPLPTLDSKRLLAVIDYND
jgi:hypothetical protein